MVLAGVFVQMFFVYFTHWRSRHAQMARPEADQIDALFARFQTHARLSWVFIVVGSLLSLQEILL